MPFYHPAALQDDDVVGQRRHVQDVVGDHQDREPLLGGPARIDGLSAEMLWLIADMTAMNL